MKVIYVADYQPELLRRPDIRFDVLDVDRAEPIHELEIISIKFREGDYHDNDNNGVHQ